MNILRRAAFCWFILLATFAMPIMATAGNPAYEVAVEYTPEHSEILLGEPLYVTFSITNKGANTFYLETGGDYRLAVRPGRFSFKALDSSGVAAKDPYPQASNFGGFLDFPGVKPHTTYSEKLFLPLWIKFDHAGRYRIHAERPLQLYSNSSPDRGAAVTNSGASDFYVTVLPANSNLLGSRIQQWGEQTKSPEQAYDAALALAYVDDERVIPYLLHVVETYKAKGGALYPAIEGLGRHPNADAVRAFTEILDNSEYYYAHYEVIEALANMKSPEAKTVLRKSLDSPDSFTRKTAAEFLGKIGDQGAIEPLKAHLVDTNSDARLACANSLVHLGAFEKGLNSPAILAQILDTTNPSVTNRYNYDLFGLIANGGGPHLSYIFVFHGETTEKELLENKKTLAAMLSWANSSNKVPEL